MAWRRGAHERARRLDALHGLPRARASSPGASTRSSSSAWRRSSTGCASSRRRTSELPAGCPPARPPLRDLAGRGQARLRLLLRHAPAARAWFPPRPRSRRLGRRVEPRPPRPADAGRARADLRQVRPAPLHAPGHRSAGHRLRAEGAAGRRHPGRLRRGRARDPGGARAHHRAALPRLRGEACRRRVDRPGAQGDAPERTPRRRQGAAAGRAAPDRSRPRAHVSGRAPRSRPREGARVHRHRLARRRVRPHHPPGARLPDGGAERRAVPPQLRRAPARARARASSGATRARGSSRSSCSRAFSSAISTRTRTPSRSGSGSRT